MQGKNHNVRPRNECRYWTNTKERVVFLLLIGTTHDPDLDLLHRNVEQSHTRRFMVPRL